MIERLATVPCVGVDYRPFTISPDGRTIAFEWYKGGDWQIYLLDLDNGSSVPRPAATVADACICPQYSADGRYLYFARDDHGSELYDVYRLDLKDDSLENVMPDTPSLSPMPDFHLSPDGAMVALSVGHGQSNAAAVLPAVVCPGATELRLLADHYPSDWSPRWSPDGRLVAWQAETQGQDSAVFLVDVASGESWAVGGSESPLQAQLATGGDVWSPDGRRLVFHGGPFDHPGIGIYELASETVTWAWAGDLDAHAATWSPDGRAIAFLVDEGVETSLWLADLVTQHACCLSDLEGMHYAPQFMPDGASIVVAHSAPNRPSELLRVWLHEDGGHKHAPGSDPGGSGEAAGAGHRCATGTGDGCATIAQLTDGLPVDLSRHPFVSGAQVWYASRDHLAQVPALYSEPDEPNGGAVVLIHGGPTWRHANEWDPLRQAFLHAGLITINPNYRGSDGYGRSWQLANRYMMGYGDLWDVVGAWDFLVEQGCDPSRIAVTGRSYGGYVTVACLTYYPDLWACGAAGVPFFDWVKAQDDPAIRNDLVWWDRENHGDPVADRQRFLDRSPFYHLERIKAPLLIVAGQNDPRCPPTQIDEVTSVIRANGVEVEAIVYPNEGHGISRAENRLDYDRRTVEFVLKHTLG